MSAPETIIEAKALQLRELIGSLPETQQQEIRDIFSWFVADVVELYALIDTAAMAFDSLQLAEGTGLGRVLFMATSQTHNIETALKSVAEDQGASHE